MKNIDNKINRADFLQKSLIRTAGLLLPASLMAQIPQQEKPPPLKIEIVKEYVTVVHGQIERLKNPSNILLILCRKCRKSSGQYVLKPD